MDAEAGSLSFEVKGKKTSVLVVDDSPEIRRYLTTALELDQYQVETAGSGEEASQRFREGCDAAIVLLDLQMPGMDGLETLQHLREVRPEVKVIMCSAVDDPDTVRRATQLGAQAYLVKPIQPLYLSAAVERCLRGSSDPLNRDLSAAMVATLPSGCRPN
jgi:CheY-like chemotaxis protein